MDRLVKRTEGVAADHARVAMSLTSLTETSSDTYATDTNEIPLLNDGLTAMSKHLRTCQSLLEDESRGWDSGVLEDLKRQRDSLVSVRELFDRREKLDKDNIPYLERRIQTNETKLAGLRAKPDGVVKPGEIEKVAEAIIKVSHLYKKMKDDCQKEWVLTWAFRTRSLLFNNIIDLYSSRSVSAMNSSPFSRRSTTSVAGIRTGPVSGSSMRKCWLIIGDDCSTSWRACRWAIN